MLINTAGRVVSGRSRFDHITDFVKDVLHWLPITQKGTVESVYFGQQGHSWECTDTLIWFGGKINGDPSTLRLAVISTLATNSSSTSLTVRRTCFCGRWSNVMEFASWRSFRYDITNSISLSTKGTFVYHRLWKQLVMMIITSAWIVIVKRQCGLVVP